MEMYIQVVRKKIQPTVVLDLQLDLMGWGMKFLCELQARALRLSDLFES